MLASIRLCHQPISRKDIIPTPSHPINNWNILLAVTKIIMEIRKSSKYLKNRLIFGSECMYHRANSKMDQVTYRATGVKVIEYRSNLKLILMSKGPIFIQFQLVKIDSRPWSRKIDNGTKLIKKEVFTAVFTYRENQLELGFL